MDNEQPPEDTPTAKAKKVWKQKQFVKGLINKVNKKKTKTGH